MSTQETPPQAVTAPASSASHMIRNPYLLAGVVTVIILVLVVLYFKSNITACITGCRSKTPDTDAPADNSKREIEDLINSINGQQEQSSPPGNSEKAPKRREKDDE